MASLEQASIRYQNEQRRQQIDSLRNDRGSVMAANASQETLGWANFIAEATPTGAKLWQQQQENARFNAQLKLFEEESNLTIATGADLAASEKFKDRQLDAFKTRGAFADALAAGYPMEQAEKLDAGASGMERDEILSQAINQVKSKAPGFIQDQIRNSGLILKDEDGNLIDVSSRTLDPAVHAGVVKFFRQKYQQANLGSPDKLGKDRWRKYKIKDDFQKIENNINSNHINVVNQAKEFERVKGLKRHINLKLKDGEEINYDYVLDTILTFTDDKGKPLDYKGAQDWLTKYVKDLAKVDSVNAQKLVTAMENGTYTGPSGGQVRFGTLRIDDMQETVIKERDDNLTTKIKADQGVAIDAALEYLSSDRGPEARQKVIDLAKKHSFNPNLVFAAEHEADQADPGLEAKALKYDAEFLGIFPSLNQSVHSDNIELRNTLAKDGRSYYGRTKNKTYENTLGDIDAILNFDGNSLHPVRGLIKIEARDLKEIAVKNLDEYILENYKKDGIEDAIKDGRKFIRDELGKIKDIDDLINHPWMKEANKGVPQSDKDLRRAAVRYVENHASSLDLTKPIDLKISNNLSNWVSTLSDTEAKSIIRHATSGTNMGPPNSVKVLTRQINRNLPSDKDRVTTKDVSTWLYESMGSPGDEVVGEPQSDQDKNNLSKTRADNSAPNLISAYDNAVKFPTEGNALNLGMESWKTLGDIDKVMSWGLATYINTGPTEVNEGGQ